MQLRLSKLNKTPAYIAAFWQIFLVKRSLNSPYKTAPQAGCSRGIDFYKPAVFYRILANAMMGFKETHGQFPNLINPKTLNEKSFWTIFFGNIKVPEAGNKLLTSRFIPEDLNNLISCPEIIWHSAQSKLPENDDIAAGTYYLKANHGSNMVKRIHYPLSLEEVKKLESVFSQWLVYEYGLTNGEWWYNTFPKELLIEKGISDDLNPIAWGVFVVGGEIAYINMVQKIDNELFINWLDSDFSLLPQQGAAYKRIVGYKLPKHAAQMKLLSLRLAAPFNFVRVDFLVDSDDTLYLGEMTFSPGNALIQRPKALDLTLGDKLKCLN